MGPPPTRLRLAHRLAVVADDHEGGQVLVRHRVLGVTLKSRARGEGGREGRGSVPGQQPRFGQQRRRQRRRHPHWQGCRQASQRAGPAPRRGGRPHPQRLDRLGRTLELVGRLAQHVRVPAELHHVPVRLRRTRNRGPRRGPSQLGRGTPPPSQAAAARQVAAAGRSRPVQKALPPGARMLRACCAHPTS
jgi:hypothetical protein